MRRSRLVESTQSRTFAQKSWCRFMLSLRPDLKPVSTVNVPYVQARHTGFGQKPSLIVLYASGTTTEAGAALGLANMMHRSTSPDMSFHYIVDESLAVQGVWDNIVAHHCSYPLDSISIKMCDDSTLPTSRWTDKPHRKMLIRTADLVAKLCVAHKIKPHFLTDEQLLKWSKHRSLRSGGIVTYAQMSRVFKPGVEWDLQGWPNYEFLAMVHSRIDAEKEVAVKKNRFLIRK